MENIGWFIIAFILWIVKRENLIGIILDKCIMEEEDM